MEALNSFLATFVGYIWGLPLVILLVGSGLFYTVYFGFPQFRLFGHALRVTRGDYDDPNDPGQLSHFKALCTALSGTVGLGNIAGVAVAIKIGGPGATIWMILAGLIGMASKFNECSLAVMYREVDSTGAIRGGPMYYIEKGLGRKFKPFSIFFAVCCVAAAIGGGNLFQSNQVASIFKSSFGIEPIWTGLTLSALTAIVILGGIKRIGDVTGTLVPVMAGIYVLGCALVVLLNLPALPGCIAEMFSSAFLGSAAIGGFSGAAVKEIMIAGVRRASFSNEAGLGSAAIAHSVARTNEKVREGVVSILEPFIDTVVICTMTAMAINISGEWQGNLSGVNLTAKALDHSIAGFGTYFIPFAVLLFGYSTMISWSFYGEQALYYLFGSKSIAPYRIIFCSAATLGALWGLDPVINFSDSAFGLMGMGNVICCLLLAPKVKVELNKYRAKLKAGEFKVYRDRV